MTNTMEQPKKNDRYVTAMQRWLAMLKKEPHSLLAGSGWFLLTCLPVITIPLAWVSLLFYMQQREHGVGVTWKNACRHSFRKLKAKTWRMGLTDLLALTMAGGCVVAILEGPFSTGIRFFYAILLLLDVIYLLSGMYRYVALYKEPETKLTLLIARGFLVWTDSPGWSLMLGFAKLLAFMICALTGVGVLLVYPALSALLSVCAYEEMIKTYLEEETQ